MILVMDIMIEMYLEECITITSHYEWINKMKTIEVTIQEIQAATRPNVYRNRKKYTRKDKYRNKQIEN
jgi:hypothetical protein